MNCTEFEARLRQSIEDRTPSVQGCLYDHARLCARCRPRWEDFALLARAIPAWTEGREEVNLVESVVAAAAEKILDLESKADGVYKEVAFTPEPLIF